MAQNKKEEAKKVAIQARSDIDDIVAGVIKNIDRPENGAWKRSVLGKIKNITTEQKEIEDLINELGVHFNGDPNNAKKLDTISRLKSTYFPENRIYDYNS